MKHIFITEHIAALKGYIREVPFPELQRNEERKIEADGRSESDERKQ